MSERNQAKKRTDLFVDPSLVRPNEKIGGGFFVFSRHPDSGRIRPSRFPFEHPDYASAKAALDRIKENQADREYGIFQEVRADA
ncbi:hypothetical protein PAF17_15850 [Paracoccus sp. Z330]|uniref:WGR domain-containing protein n=1 Tax=Paracoccus onchidii TaxID=3017813 RepID=A0ABT4ZJS0_9RHOB|nr:hypothetical protein [Paracoccus onchidii]MDB6178965.1 hypothetical protein [Paracoccus onchidii]